MIVEDAIQSELLMSRFNSYYFKYGDTLYQEYRIIYLAVVKDEADDCKRQGRDCNREGLC